MESQLIKSESTPLNKGFNIDGFLAKRQEFIQKVGTIMVDGKDYHVIQGKKSMAKGGAEKIASIFNWSAKFEKDIDVMDALNDLPGLIAFKCTLIKGKTVVGEGRGASTLTKNSNDPNKTIKMAQKSAFIDAVLRTSGLSDFFTQDLEDMNITDLNKTSSVNAKSPVESQEYFCSVHGNTIKQFPAGVAKSGKSYNAFWACTDKSNGYCKAAIVNIDHVRVRQSPETGEMILDKQEVELPDPAPVNPDGSEYGPESESVNIAKNILGLTYDAVLDQINKSKDLKELSATAENLKYMKKQLTAGQYALLMNQGKQKKVELTK